MVELELVKFENAAFGTRRFYFKPSEKVEFKPGNHTTLEMEVNGEHVKKPFTFVSLPSDELLEFIIKKVGPFTTKLFDLEIGDKITMGKVFGRYSFSDDYIGKKLVCIAGGTGIVPFICMKHYVEKHGLDVKFKVILSAKTEEYLLGAADIVTLTQQEKEGYFNQRIDKEFLLEHISSDELENCPILVCGPAVFEKAVKDLLTEIGAKHVS